MFCNAIMKYQGEISKMCLLDSIQVIQINIVSKDQSNNFGQEQNIFFTNYENLTILLVKSVYETF